MDETLFIGGAGPSHDRPQALYLSRANRHGLISGATGTGKTVTLQILAEGFSRAGVPVFCADVKGDLSGLSQPGDPDHELHAKLQSRAATIGLADFGYAAAPTLFWDVFGAGGHPVRATVSEMGPLLLSRLLGLTEVQEGVLTVAFTYADDEGLLLIDLKDLQKLLAHLGETGVRETVSRQYGAVASQSLGAIQRRLLMLEREGAEHFFGEPALRLEDLMRTTRDGRGQVSILDARKLINAPRLYATFLLWLLAELFESLPEVGDPDRPRLVFFFDEAHLLFSDAPPALLEKVEQVVRLIRSKGVGVYFVTQTPRDIPDSVLAQLGNRIQHALRAYTPAERKAVRAAAASFRPNPEIDTEQVITELGVGEALVSMLDAKGVPTPVERTLIRPPASRLGPASEAERALCLTNSPLAGLYDRPLDRDSAYEALDRREAEAAEAAEAARQTEAREARETRRIGRQPAPARRRSNRQTPTEAAVSTVVRTVARDLARHVLRGLLGSRRR